MPSDPSGLVPIASELTADPVYTPFPRGDMQAWAHRGAASRRWWIGLSAGSGGPTFYRPIAEAVRLRDQLSRGLSRLAESMLADATTHPDDRALIGLIRGEHE